MKQTEHSGYSSRAQGADLYLDLLEKVLTRTGFETDVAYHELNIRRHPPIVRRPVELAQTILGLRSKRIMDVRRFDPAMRREGGDCPADAETMIGLARLRNLRECLQQVFEDDVPGDVLEAGVWRGGASIYMRGVLKAYGQDHRISWLADSFRGLPVPTPGRYPADKGSVFHNLPELAVGKAQVIANFERFDLLDEQVRLLEGWFSQTLATAPVESLALLRLDGDMYESTTQTLDALYDLVSPGGFVVVDDYGNIDACRQATDDYRHEHGVDEPLQKVDWNAVYWRKDLSSTDA